MSPSESCTTQTLHTGPDIVSPTTHCLYILILLIDSHAHYVSPRKTFSRPVLELYTLCFSPTSTHGYMHAAAPPKPHPTGIIHAITHWLFKRWYLVLAVLCCLCLTPAVHEWKRRNLADAFSPEEWRRALGQIKAVMRINSIAHEILFLMSTHFLQVASVCIQSLCLYKTRVYACDKH